MHLWYWNILSLQKPNAKMIDDKQMTIAIQVIQWLVNEWIIGQNCFYPLPLRE